MRLRAVAPALAITLALPLLAAPLAVEAQRILVVGFRHTAFGVRSAALDVVRQDLREIAHVGKADHQR